jgi:hypothetical protein
VQKENLAILILSCDKYADVWPTFYDFLFKYWPDCPYKIYNASNFLSYEHQKVTNIHSKQLSDWSTETKAILNQIEEKHILLILEDYFVYRPVDMNLIKKSMDIMEEKDALFLKLSCFPSMHNSRWQYDKIGGKPFIAEIRLHQEYRVNLQIGVWNKKLLYDLIHNGESPWEFELNASERSNKIINPCLCIVEDPKKNYVHGPITYLCTALSKGVWMRDAIELCNKEQIKIEIGNRQIETHFEYLFRKLYTKTPLSKRKYINFLRNVFHFQYH